MGVFDQLWDTLRTSPAADAVRQVQMHGGVLPSIYSAADSVKRRLSDAVGHPLDYLAQTAGQLQDHPEAIQGAFMPDGAGLGTHMPAFAGTFGGYNALTANKDAAFNAARRLAAGHDPATVWKETGWGLGPDKNMRFEIPDNTAKFNGEMDIHAANLAEAQRIKDMKAQATDLFRQRLTQPDLFPKQLNTAIGDLRDQAKAAEAARTAPNGLDSHAQYRGNLAPLALEHPELYAAYPDLAANIIRQGADRGPGSFGARVGTNIDINKPALARDPLSTALHEMQHGVQDQEAFSRGGNQEMFTSPLSPVNRPLLDRLHDLNEQTPPPGPEGRQHANDVYDTRAELLRRQNDPFSAYQRLAGEAEARLTQARMNMTPEERANSYPFDPDYFKQTTGVGIGDLIHIDDKGQPTMSAQAPNYPQAEALETARRNGVSMLGLPEHNTPMDRAAAMGYADEGYHGSLNDIHAFNPNKASTESHAGMGTYITDSAEDASRNYASIYGPDVAGKVTRRLEESGEGDRPPAPGWYDKLQNETLTPNQTRLLTERYLGADNAGTVYPLMFKKGQAAHLDNPKLDTHIEGMERYDPEEDEYFPSDTFHDWERAQRNVNNLVDGGEPDMLAHLAEQGYTSDGARAGDIYDTVHKNAGDLYDNNGDLLSGAAVAGEFLKGLGIDTIQHTPQFRNAQLNLGNTHSIVFDPSHIRSRFAAFDPARAHEPDLLAGYMPPASTYQQQDDPQPGALTQAITAP